MPCLKRGMAEPVLLKLPLRLRNVATKDGEVFAPSVHCPRRNESIDAVRCTGCARMSSIEWTPGEGGDIGCLLEPAEVPAPPRLDRRTDIAEAAARCQLHELVQPVTVCVRPDRPMKEVRELFILRNLRAVPVVDEELRLVGIVSRSDVMVAPPDALVSDAMPARTHALPEHAPVGFAIALMALEGVSEVPVVTEDGEIVGLFDAIAALRWTAERMGYVLTSGVASAE